MSASSEYESAARQDYGPTTSSENGYEHVLEHKLADNMSVPSVRAPVLRVIPVSPTEGDPEPDSTNPESIIQSTHTNSVKEVEYHIAESRCEGAVPVDSLSSIVRIEEATLESAGHIPYPIIQETDDSNDGNYVENSTTLIQTPLSTAIVQNVTKLPQNFTINVDAAVGNITAIQNLSQDVSGNQTLWLPTILATSAAPPDNKTEDDRQQAGVSQIIITSESYTNDAGQLGRKANIVSETNYINRQKGSKVQILSNIPIPKNSNYSQPYIAHSKELPSPVYGQNHVYKLSTNVVSQNLKHINNSVLCTKPPKNQSLIGGSNATPVVVNNSPMKNLSYGHTFSKNTNLNKTLNKVNNGANLNAMVAASSSNSQCHILSRVVSGPNKMSVHSGRKSVNAFKGSKSSSQVSGSQKNQSRAIKIIQQTGSVHKSEGKSWPVANVATYKNQQPIYGVVESNTSKIIQKVGSPPHKNQTSLALSKFPSKGERLVLQSPCGPVLISTAPISTSLPKGPHYVQSGSTPNLRYVQTYGSTEQLSSTSQVSANQQLTAQILQSLSQPKLMFQPSPGTISHTLPLTTSPAIIEEMDVIKPLNQKRIVFGDKTTLLTADDILGMEERPNLSEELRRYSFHSALVMLDHTYSLPAQKQPSPPPSAPPEPPRAPAPTAPAPAPASPAPRTDPVIVATAAYEPPAPEPPAPAPAPALALAPAPAPAAPPPAPPQPPPIDDDAASVISSVDGSRPPRGGSDTETAPEGEEEGKTRCVCDFTHDDGYMICCDRCGEWQHVDCMGIDRQNIPDAYMCELCSPRPVDRRHARNIQLRKREELSALGASDSDSSEHTRLPGQRRKRLLTVTTYTNTSGTCVTTYNSAAPTLPPAPQPSLTLPKRGPKRPKKTEVVRKGTKRKLTEKRVKRKKEMMMNRSKYNSSISSQSHWQESYELAMTNHYSPELRAKLMKYSSKLGNTPNMASAISAHLCTTVPHAGGKILIATKDLKETTPIIELRGKYMLSNQHKPQLQNTARAGSQKPGPFVFFYRLPKDNIQICIDTRTYGNEARFVRRSCKPNAELQHCIVKGTLHVYLVTIGIIQSNTEITVGHDSSGAKQPCACGNPKHCKVNGFSSMVSRKSMDYPPREKRSRNRCSSSSSPVSSPPAAAPLTPVKEFTPQLLQFKSEKISPIKHEYPPLSPVKDTAVAALSFDEPIKDEVPEIKTEMDLMANEEMKPDLDEVDFVKSEAVPEAQAPLEEKVEQKEEIKEEPKPEVKPEPIKERPIKERKIKEEEPIKEVKEQENFSEEEEEKQEVEEKEILKKHKEEPKIEDERPMTRELAAKSACHDRSARSSRTTCANQDSLDDKTDDSQDKLQTTTKEKDKKKMTREERKMEAIMKAFERMEKAEQRKQEVKERQKRRESDPHPSTADKDDEEDHCTTKKRKRRKGRARTTSQSARRRLDSADSDLVTSGDEAPPAEPPSPDPPQQDLRPHTDTVQEDLGLSSACLLVEAAVGSVESAFKLPKTKKTIATEWVGRSPERTPSPYRSPYRPALVTAPSLESLVRVASTMIGDLSGQGIDHEDETQQSPPRTPGRDRNRPPKKAKRVTRSTPEVVEAPPPPPPQHSAKKRWLRQAISEESDSPSAESPPNEMVTPLKKRRVARESLSYETNTIVPCHDETSPVLTSDSSPAKGSPARGVGCAGGALKARSIMEGRAALRGPHAAAAIRRIIGVPDGEPDGPETPDDRNNNTDHKPEPMEIDHTVPQPKIEPGDPASPDTSDSSPQRDEMDDIQKKIHSFHTENILFLKSRNRKPPKEKRKKVNLNFDLNMVDDRISIQLRTDSAALAVAPENIPLPDETVPLPAPENIPLPAEPSPMPTLPPPEAIPLPIDPPAQAPTLPLPISPPASPSPPPATQTVPPDAASTVPFSTRFSTGLFSGIFGGLSSHTQTYEADAGPAPSQSTADDLRSVQEILTRVNSMQPRHSLLLAGLPGAGDPLRASPPERRPGGASPPRRSRQDPRLHPPPQEKPKPVRRKLSITEYRLRLAGHGPSDDMADGSGSPADWSSGSGSADADDPASSRDPRDPRDLDRLDVAAKAAQAALESRLHRDLADSSTAPRGVFDAQPTASERQRENLSARLRREFGLALPDDDAAPKDRPGPAAPAAHAPSEPVPGAAERGAR